jgi:hypothetical protein
VIRIYESPVEITGDGEVANPEPDAVIIDGGEYRKVTQWHVAGGQAYDGPKGFDPHCDVCTA